jgi:hypothetical protein
LERSTKTRIFAEKKKGKQMISVANPIYDVVFKYLMEDERIARTILSALLKMDITHVELQSETIQRSLRDVLSVCRASFIANINDHNTNKISTISIVKMRHPHKILSLFPLQQSDILIYLLGHEVEDIKAPIVDIRSCNVDDFNGNNGVIIQIPRIKYTADNRHDMILSIFGLANQHNQHVIAINDQNYGSDTEVSNVIQRLQAIASDLDKRMDMNFEDEYFYHLSKQYESFG